MHRNVGHAYCHKLESGKKKLWWFWFPGSGCPLAPTAPTAGHLACEEALRHRLSRPAAPSQGTELTASSRDIGLGCRWIHWPTRARSSSEADVGRRLQQRNILHCTLYIANSHIEVLKVLKKEREKVNRELNLSHVAPS